MFLAVVKIAQIYDYFVVKCLIISRPFIDQILNGDKVEEFRTTDTKLRGKIGLIASGEKGRIIGEVEIVGTRRNETEYGGWAWRLRNPVRYDSPVLFEQPLGCVIWVNSLTA